MRRALILIALVSALLAPAPLPAQQNPAGQALRARTEALAFAPEPQRDMAVVPDVFALTGRRKDLIRARIYVRLGRLPEAVAVYEKLLGQDPKDAEVLESYIQALFDLNELDKAEALVNAWLKREPANPSALRLKAYWYVRTGRYPEAADAYAEVLKLNPGDPGTMGDLAYARRMAGQWPRALELYQKLCEADPDNREYADAVREILAERRPRLDVGYRFYAQANDAVTNTVSTAFTMQMTERWRATVEYDVIGVYRPRAPDAPLVDKLIQDRRVKAAFAVNRDLELWAGVGFWDGTKSAFSQSAGVNWRMAPQTQIRITGYRNQPWYDIVEAADYNGSWDEAGVVYDGFYSNAWGVYLDGRWRSYAIDGASPYGQKGTVNFILSRRLFSSPEVFVSYSYYRSHFEYAEKDYRPVSIVRDEDLHQFSMSLRHTFTPWLDFSLYGGGGQDLFKTSPVWFGGPEFIVRLGERLIFRTGYEYRSDTEQVVGGENHTLTSTMSVIF